MIKSGEQVIDEMIKMEEQLKAVLDSTATDEIKNDAKVRLEVINSLKNDYCFKLVFADILDGKSFLDAINEHIEMKYIEETYNDPEYKELVKQLEARQDSRKLTT